jgi:hypothetical protein
MAQSKKTHTRIDLAQGDAAVVMHANGPTELIMTDPGDPSVPHARFELGGMALEERLREAIGRIIEKRRREFLGRKEQG